MSGEFAPEIYDVEAHPAERRSIFASARLHR
jgi:hypothetical protein